MRVKFQVVLVTLLAAATARVGAHHSFAAEFDQYKPVKLSGSVTKMEWINPHAWLYIDVKGVDGNLVNWAIECGAPNTLLRRGWRTDSLKPGTTVVVEGFASKSGRQIANGSNLTFPDGRTLFVGTAGVGAPYDKQRQ